MALTDENGSGMVMPVAPMYGSGGGNGFGNGFGGDGWWIILLFIILGGWGNNFGGGAGYGGGAGGLYPWMNQAEITSDGFRDQMLNSNISGIRDSLGDISTQLCNGFAGVEQGANARQIANMQTAFANQTAMTQGFNSLASQFANCCCENRLGTADLKYTIATENCADRTQSLMNTRDIIDSQTRGTQAILDKLCALELDGVKGQLAQAQRENVGLQNQLNMANLAASQTAQNSTIIDGIYNRLNNCPVGTVPVYGEQPIFTCPNNNSGCGCGCNGAF